MGAWLWGVGREGAGPGASCFWPQAAGKHLLRPGVSSVHLPRPASCGPHGAWAAGHGPGDGVGAAVARVLRASAGSG